MTGTTSAQEAFDGIVKALQSDRAPNLEHHEPAINANTMSSRHSDCLSDIVTSSSAWDDQEVASITRRNHHHSQGSSGVKSPCSSDEAFHRVASTPFLPSASSANFGYLVKRLATIKHRVQPAHSKRPSQRGNEPIRSQQPRRPRTVASDTSDSLGPRVSSSGVDLFDDPLANGSTREFFEPERPIRDPSEAAPNNNPPPAHQPLRPQTPPTTSYKPGSRIAPSYPDATTEEYESSSSGRLADEYDSSLSDSDDDSDSDGDDDAKFRRIAEQWSDLRERQRALHSTYSNIGREREALGDVRQKKNQAYNQVRFAINKILRDHPDLDDLFREAERADLRCQQVETNLDTLLDGLEEEQIQLENEQRRFFTAIAQSEPSTKSSSSHPESRTSLRGIQAERAEVLHPTLQAYDEALQELQLAQEFRTNLLVQRKLLDMEGEYIDEGNKEFLQEYNGLQQHAHQEIDRWSRAVSERKKVCQEAALLGPTASDTTTDIQLAGASTPMLAHPRFPLLLSNPTHLLEEALPQTAMVSLRTATSLPPKLPGRKQRIEAASREFGIETLFIPDKDEGRQGYVNRWLLHKLRLSAMEAELLSSTFQTTLKILDWGQWQRDVLFHWTRDEAATQPMPGSEALSDYYGVLGMEIEDLLRTSTLSRLSRLSNLGDRTPQIQEHSTVLIAPSAG
ncbi:hypothetical protein PG994_009152 [Apiospora phragmitis]|uniref:Uncharacterized protein n=1 Tax=Apiospora phragmitis TaxID=2905665 RepID=A0ABR1UIH8_9PEZI